MKISDFRGIFRTSELEVESVENPYGDYYTVKIRIPKGYSWIPGEHGIFKLPGKNIQGKKWRAFSVASNPKEGFMLIGTRTGREISSFKSALTGMKKGEKISVRGPFGWFKVMDNKTPIVMIAGGVGITPIRAVAKSLEMEKSRPVHIIYSSKDYYLFGDDFDEMATNNASFHVSKYGSSSETKAAVDKITSQFENGAFYYISGSQAFISSISDQLKSSGVSKKRIINDPFLGY